MNRTAVTSATLAAGVTGAAFMQLLITISPLGPGEDRTSYYITQAVLSVPWAVAAWLVWRGGRRRLSEVDGPARLVAAAVAMLPIGRADWGAAMTAELGEVSGRRARWHFAAGCLRTAMIVRTGGKPAGDPARYVALAMTGVLGVVLLEAVRRNQEGILFALMLAPAAGLFSAGLVAAAIGRTFTAGLRAVTWMLAIAVPLIFAGYVAAAFTWYHGHGTMLLDGATGPAGQNLHDAVFWTLGAVPLWALPFGVIGAAAGSATAGFRSRTPG